MPTNATVQITYDPNAKPQLSVSPESASVLGQGNLTWNVAAPAGTTIVITFAGGCPFPPTGEQPTGEYRSSGASITTQNASPDTNGTWTYSVTTSARATASTNAAVVVQNNP